MAFNPNSFNEWYPSVMQQNQEDEEAEDAVITFAVPLITSTIERPIQQRTYLARDCDNAYSKLQRDYFGENPCFREKTFRRRFRMRKHVFLCIVETLGANDEFFQHMPDATGKLGISPLANCTAAMQMIAYGVPADAVDDYLEIPETTARKALHHFIEGIISQFCEEYLRRPTLADTRRLLREGEQRDFPSMMGSIDCMHWQWKNCPRGWKWQFQGRNHKATLILEAVASRDLWIQHAFFGTPGACNDINVLDRSSMFDDIHGELCLVPIR